MDKKLIQKIIIFACIAAGVILLVFGVQKLIKKEDSPSAELQLKTLISENIENWEGYQLVSEDKYKKFGNDSTCPASAKGSEEFLSYYEKAVTGDIRALDLTSGAHVLYTPNYNNWNNAKLYSFMVQDMRVCSSGWLIPLAAYPDKIVWANATCSDVAKNEMEGCQLIMRIVMGYFAQKGQ